MRNVNHPGGGILMSIAAALILAAGALAHPGSGIVVDRLGNVYFVDTGRGVWRIDAQGRLTPHAGPAFHWMTIDEAGRFAGKKLPSTATSEMREIGVDPTLILSSDFPVTTGSDGALYFPQLRSDDRLEVIRLAPSGAREVRARLPAATESGPLRWLNGIAAGGDGSIYYTENRAVRKIAPDGAISSVAGNVAVPDCVPIPGAGPELGPLLRGLDAASDGTLYVAATGCSALLRITAAGEVTPVLRAASPWSPTGVAVAGDAVYVLEYLHVSSDDRRDWVPRVRKLAPDGSVVTVASVERR